MTDFKNHLFVLIVCGGSGTRLWPRSRRKTPKQFLNLFGEKSLFTQTMERARALAPDERIFISTNIDYVDEVLEQSNLSLKNIIAEPQRRNTAIAIIASAAVIAKIDPQAVIVNLWSDHLISPLEKFTADVNLAAEVAFSGDYLVDVGLKPTFPHTGWGYLHAVEPLLEFKEKQVLKVKEFKEKPDLKTAEMFCQSGEYYWNIGLYTWRADNFLKACAKYAPKIYQGAMIIQSAWGTKEEKKIFDEVWSQTEEISIDYAVSEKADNLVLIPASFNWSDVGDWQTVYDAGQKDENGNMIIKLGKGEIYNIESTKSLIQFSDRLVALVGVKDLVVIDTPDALLVCQKENAQGVKKIVEALKENGKKEYL
ncbi:sugar phosphate nucleotidyltransferase [Patescibacteria group bacterium]|nr:sugar phosphate nucleotidyltransferase [Patescibacteria group bacterium]